MADKNRLNVLVVDPDESTVLELKDWLTEEGYRASAVTDANSVIEEIKHGRYQMVVLDVSPTRGPRHRDDAAHPRHRARTSASSPPPTCPRWTWRCGVLKAQAFDYLPKPIAPEELQHVTEAAIREKGLLVDIEARLNQIVGGRLRERRTEAGLTLKQLANRTGLSVSLISQIELGKSAASMSTLHKLATALQVKMTFFFETV